jgi:hypothetical protein
MSVNKIRSALYKAASLLGDIQAVRKGPKAIAKRIVRKAAGRGFGSFMNKFFK